MYFTNLDFVFSGKVSLHLRITPTSRITPCLPLGVISDDTPSVKSEREHGTMTINEMMFYSERQHFSGCFVKVI